MKEFVLVLLAIGSSRRLLRYNQIYSLEKYRELWCLGAGVQGRAGGREASQEAAVTVPVGDGKDLANGHMTVESIHSVINVCLLLLGTRKGGTQGCPGSLVMLVPPSEIGPAGGGGVRALKWRYQ